MKLRLGGQSRRALAVLRAAGEGCLEHDTFGMGASLAFYTVFSLGPLLVIATAVATRFIGDEATQTQLVNWAKVYLGAEGARAVQGMIAGALNRFSGFLATIVGVVTLFFGVTGVFGRLKHSLNVMWGVDAKAHPVVKRLLLTRLKALAVAGLIGVMLFAGIVLSAGVMAVGGFVGRWLPMSIRPIRARHMSSSIPAPTGILPANSLLKTVTIRMNSAVAYRSAVITPL